MTSRFNLYSKVSFIFVCRLRISLKNIWANMYTNYLSATILKVLTKIIYFKSNWFGLIIYNILLTFCDYSHITFKIHIFSMMISWTWILNSLIPHFKIIEWIKTSLVNYVTNDQANNDFIIGSGANVGLPRLGKIGFKVPFIPCRYVLIFLRDPSSLVVPVNHFLARCPFKFHFESQFNWIDYARHHCN